MGERDFLNYIQQKLEPEIMKIYSTKSLDVGRHAEKIQLEKRKFQKVYFERSQGNKKESSSSQVFRTRNNESQNLNLQNIFKGLMVFLIDFIFQ